MFAGRNLHAIKTAVDQDWLQSHHLGITAVPTFRMNGENLVDVQPYGLADAVFLEYGFGAFDDVVYCFKFDDPLERLLFGRGKKEAGSYGRML